MGKEEKIAKDILKDTLFMFKDLNDILVSINTIVNNLATKDYITGKLEVLEEKLKAHINLVSDKNIQSDLKEDIRELADQIKVLKELKSDSEILSDNIEELLD